MRIQKKKEILEYLKSHNDGTDVAKNLIKFMESDCYYADCDCYSICYDDIEDLTDEAKTKVENYFGKPIKELDHNDYQTLADLMADMITDEYSENLYNTIEYQI